ncbi:MAG: YihY/virulence factor BrkB family protein [Desulforhopalus sp.]
MTVPPQADRLVDHPSIIAWVDQKDSDVSRIGAAARYVVRIVLIIVQQFGKNELSIRSGALTYTIMLSLVPMLAMSTAVVKGLGGGDQLKKAAYSYIDSLEGGGGNNKASPGTPDEGEPSSTSEDNANLTNHLRDAATKLFNYVDRTNFATLGSFGVIGILVTALMVFGHIESAMNAIWKVTAGRSILRKLADYLTLLVLMPISINVAFAATALLESPALAAKMNILVPTPWLQSLLLKPLPILFIAVTFCVMYIFFPNTKVRTLPAVLGATLAAILLFTVQNIYVSLQVGVAKYNAIYGSFATLPLFLAWLYLAWLFILTGAQLAFALQNTKSYQLIATDAPPSFKLGAAFDIMDHVYQAFTEQRPLTAVHMHDELPLYTHQLLGEVILELNRAGLVHVSNTDARLLPTVPAERYDKQQILTTILGTTVAQTAGGKLSLQAIENVGRFSLEDSSNSHQQAQ